MNCLEYALNYWWHNPDYIILYNSDHAINVPKGTKVEGFLPLEDFGEEGIKNSFNLASKYRHILHLYFQSNALKTVINRFK